MDGDSVSEPTLGERFDAYAQYCIRDDYGPPEDRGRLIAYADACERLARAVDAKEYPIPAVIIRRVDFGNMTNLVYDGSLSYRASQEYDAALIAYRKAATP